ncbi:poly-gamma-glutamate biosynthesis protein PgsC/CapC [Halalkalicoccus ordinarius]|uniref:poly-gamma-glutamate biosynthesis protein PgsC/CapC n=1 Tax=Halalkalicoccus ordinarius TaxID=3116651 RepID=UPI00300EC458
MLVAALISIIGIVLGIAIVEKTGLRMGGVIVVPVLAVYSLYTFTALPLFLLSAAIAYVLVGLIRQRTLIYGRQLLIASLGVGAIVPVLATLTFDLWTAVDSVVEIAFVGTILPGIAVYNYHKLDEDQKTTDIAISLGALAGLIVLGAALVNPTLATRLSPGAASVLFTPGSDIAAVRGAVQGEVVMTTHLSRSVLLALIGLGVALSEAAQGRWGIRMGG